MIPVHLSSVPEEELLDEAVLWERLEKEIPYIVGHCISEYEKSGSKKVSCSKKDIYAAIDHENWDLQAIFDLNFVGDRMAVAGQAEVELSQFYNVIGFKGKRAARGTIAHDMKEFVEKEYGSRFLVCRTRDGRSARMITGIRWKELRPGESR